MDSHMFERATFVNGDTARCLIDQPINLVRDDIEVFATLKLQWQNFEAYLVT